MKEPAPLACSFLEVPEIRSRIWVSWDAGAVCRLAFQAAGAGPPHWAQALAQRPLPEAFADLERYLAGAPVDPADLPYRITGTAFQRRVWEALRNVRRGAVRSYAGIAQDVGEPRAQRAVGMANGANPIPIVVPCHRIVESGFGLGGFSGGLERKRFLLTLEGVPVTEGRVQPGQLSLL